MSAFDTFSNNGLGHVAGQVEKQTGTDIVSREVLTTGGIGAGLAVIDVDGYGVDFAGSGETPNGITIFEPVMDNNSSGEIDYTLGYTASVIRVGRVWVSAAGAVAGDAVKAAEDTGVISSSGTLTITGARYLTSTGSDGLALVQLSGNQEINNEHI